MIIPNAISMLLLVGVLKKDMDGYQKTIKK